MRGKTECVARPAPTSLQNSGVTGPKFTKFSPDVFESSAALTRASMLRFSHLLWNANTQNEGGYADSCQLLRPLDSLPWQRRLSHHGCFDYEAH